MLEKEELGDGLNNKVINFRDGDVTDNGWLY